MVAAEPTVPGTPNMTAGIVSEVTVTACNPIKNANAVYAFMSKVNGSRRERPTRPPRPGITPTMSPTRTPSVRKPIRSKVKRIPRASHAAAASEISGSVSIIFACKSLNTPTGIIPDLPTRDIEGSHFHPTTTLLPGPSTLTEFSSLGGSSCAYTPPHRDRSSVPDPKFRVFRWAEGISSRRLCQEDYGTKFRKC